LSIYFTWGDFAGEFCSYTDIVLYYLAANNIFCESFYDLHAPLIKPNADRI